MLLPHPRRAAPPLPAGSSFAVAGLSPLVTPNADFYRIDTALSVPQVDPDHWTLKVHGRVDHPFELTFAEVLAMPMVEEYVTLSCVSNEVGGPLIGNAKWLGVPLPTLLDRAGIQKGADQIVGRSVDDFTAGIPTAALLDGRVALLAVGMNGEPLPTKHGFPARLVVAGLYGYVSATKWVTELEATTFADYDAYWVPRGWAQQAPIKTESRIDVPRQRHAGVGPDRGRRRGVGAAPRDQRRRGAGRQRPVATGAARDRDQREHLAPVALPVAGDRGNAPAAGARHRRHRRGADRAKRRRRRPTAPPATTPSSSRSRSRPPPVLPTPVLMGLHDRIGRSSPSEPGRKGAGARSRRRRARRSGRG